MPLTIVTGKYETAAQEQKDEVSRFLGNENTAQDFVNQEPVVNDFAIAYWIHYGEQEKLELLEQIVLKSHERFVNPAPGIHYFDYAKSNWNNPDFWSFNNYGWFQFSCVKNSLANPKSLEEMLDTMSDRDILPQSKKVFKYDINVEMSSIIVSDAVKIINQWGVDIPPLTHVFDDHPFKQMCINTDWQTL